MSNVAKVEYVSVILPVYNASRFINETIESVINQSYKYWELIIIDDCSSDNSYEIIKKYLSIPNVFYFRNEKNSGVSFSRNMGITKAKNEWIAFIDSDDIWSENKLENQIRFTINNKSYFSFTSVEYMDINSMMLPGKFIVKGQINYEKLLKTNLISCSSVLINKKLLINSAFGNDKIHEDYVLWLSILKKGHTALAMSDVLLKYRILKNSKSGNKLKSVKMTYGVYKALKLNAFYATIYTLSHLFHALIKHRRIRRK